MREYNYKDVKTFRKCFLVCAFLKQCTTDVCNRCVRFHDLTQNRKRNVEHTNGLKKDPRVKEFVISFLLVDSLFFII